MSAVEVYFSPAGGDGHDNLWQELRLTDDESPLNLWELPTRILGGISKACKMGLNRAKKTSNFSDKLRITYDAVESILQERQHPRGLTRRVDFVPHSVFISDQVTQEMLCEATFASDEVDWLTKAVSLPPVQLWPGIDLRGKGFSLSQLLCLFARAMKDDCFASIQLGPVSAVHEGRQTERGLLRLMDPNWQAGASAHKGRIVWVAENSDLVESFKDEDNEDMGWNTLGNQSFYRNFAIGNLYLVESMDVTNSKMRLRPSINAQGNGEDEEGAQGVIDMVEEYPGAEIPQFATWFQNAAFGTAVQVINDS